MAGTAAAPENDFAEVYRANVKSVTAFFARRSTEPQTVADLTSETFVQAIASARHFDARRGSPRAWLLGIARVVYARHCAGLANGHELAERLAGQVQLADDELSELAERIDAQQLGRDLLARWQRLPEIERRGEDHAAVAAGDLRCGSRRRRGGCRDRAGDSGDDERAAGLRGHRGSRRDCDDHTQ